jgi:hypothetical protein
MDNVVFPILENIVTFSNNLNIKYAIAGAISLILVSKKIYRTPDDIDILIDGEDILKWIALLNNDWYLMTSKEKCKEILKIFLRKTPQEKFDISGKKTDREISASDLIEWRNLYSKYGNPSIGPLKFKNKKEDISIDLWVDLESKNNIHKILFDDKIINVQDPKHTLAKKIIYFRYEDIDDYLNYKYLLNLN